MPLLNNNGSPKTHGGKRAGSGRKAYALTSRPLTVRCSDEEWESFMSMLSKNTRERFEYLYSLLSENSNEIELLEDDNQ